LEGIRCTNRTDIDKERPARDADDDDEEKKLSKSPTMRSVFAWASLMSVGAVKMFPRKGGGTRSHAMGGAYLEGEGMGVGPQAAVQVHFGCKVKERTVAAVAAVFVVVVVGCSFVLVGSTVGLVLAKRAMTTGSVALAGKVGRASAEMEPQAVEETVHLPHVARDSSRQARMVSHHSSIFLFIATFVYTVAVMIVVAVIVVVFVEAIVVVMVVVWPHVLKQRKTDTAQEAGERWRGARRARGIICVYR